MPIFCQLKTHFSCSCPNCTGEGEETVHHQESPLLLCATSRSTSSSSSSFTLSFTNTAESHQTTTTSTSNTAILNTHVSETLSSFIDLEFIDSDSDSQEDVEKSVNEGEMKKYSSSSFQELQQQEELGRSQILQEEYNLLSSSILTQKSLVQKKQRQQRSYLQIAQALKRKQRQCCFSPKEKALNEKPRHLIFDVELIPTCPEWHQKQLIRQHKKFRFNQKRLRQRLFKINGPYMPNWCYEENCNSLRSLREVTVINLGTTNEVTNEPEFQIYDRRLTTDHIRLPHTQAIANRIRREWLLKHRIFNCETPFSQKSTSYICDDEDGEGSVRIENNMIPIIDEKQDSRGERNFATRCKYHRIDDSRRCNRRSQNPARNNGWEGGRKWDLGNSTKKVHGKPWLHSRNKNKSKARRCRD